MGSGGGEESPPAHADEAGAHEALRAFGAAAGAGDHCGDGPESCGVVRRRFHVGTGRALGWTLLRDFLVQAGPAGSLSLGGLPPGPERTPVARTGPTIALGACLSGAALAAIHLAAVAAGADEAHDPAARAEEEPKAKTGQAISSEGWTKAAKCETLMAGGSRKG